MSEALVKVTSLDEMKSLAQTFSKSPLLPEALRGKEADVLFILLTGAEMGIPAMTSLRTFDIIKGKVAMKPEAMVAHVRADSKVEYIRCTEATEKRAVWVSKMKSQPESAPTVFTMEDAKAAQLAGQENYRKWPARMLQWRAASIHCKMHHSDIILGLYSSEEVESFEAKDVTPAAAGAAAVASVKRRLLHVPLDEAPVPAATPPALSPGDDTPVIGWGKNASRPLAELTDEELAWYLSEAGEAGARKHAPASAERLLESYRDEGARRVAVREAEAELASREASGG